MKIVSYLAKKTVFVLILASFFIMTQEVRPEPPSNRRSDGRPLLLSVEKNDILRLIREISERNKADSIGMVGFISLNRQSSSFQGKTVTIEGRLLRTGDWTTLRDKDSNGQKIYESWVLLDDEKSIPVRLWTTRIPDLSTLSPPTLDESQEKIRSSLRQDRIRATGIYYRLIPFSDGSDLYNSPTLIAPDFEIVQLDPRTVASNPKTRAPIFPSGRLLYILPLLIAWIFLRKFFRRNHKRTLTILLFALLSLFETELFAAEGKKLPPTDRTRLLQELFRMKDRYRLLAGGEDFRGTLREIEEVELTPQEQELTGITKMIRLTISRTGPKDQTVEQEVWTIRLPDFEINRQGRSTTADQKTEISEPGAFSGQGERVGGLARSITLSDGRTVLLLPRLGWYPTESLLGRLGMDVATFDPCPVYPVSALSKKDADERKTILQALRFHEADRPLIHELLTAVTRAQPGFLKQNAKELPSVVELFNRPEQYQGSLVQLRGHVRRALYVPIPQKEYRERYGLDHYYQLYLYTSDSQGYPLVISVPELPKGMPIGSEKEYREEISIAAFFFKTWAYQSQSETDSTKWLHVPCLIGGDVEWFPEKESDFPKDFPWQYYWGSFFLLVAFYLFLRRRVAKEKISRLYN